MLVILQVDNGCIDHLIPSLHDEDWDVLISHFLGVVWLISFDEEYIFFQSCFILFFCVDKYLF